MVLKDHPYEADLKIYCDYVKEVVGKSERPPEKIIYGGLDKETCFAPVFHLWNPVSQYHASPPFCFQCNMKMVPRGLGITCNSSCSVNECEKCFRLKGWKLAPTRKKFGPRTILGLCYWEELVSRVYYCYCSSVVSTNEDYCNNLSAFIQQQIPCILTWVSGVSISLADEIEDCFY